MKYQFSNKYGSQILLAAVLQIDWGGATNALREEEKGCFLSAL